MEQQFKVGERVWFTLGGKRHISKIVSFVPGIMGGVIVTVIVDGKEVAVGLESLTKTGKNKDKEQITRL